MNSLNLMTKKLQLKGYLHLKASVITITLWGQCDSKHLNIDSSCFFFHLKKIDPSLIIIPFVKIAKFSDFID